MEEIKKISYESLEKENLELKEAISFLKDRNRRLTLLVNNLWHKLDEETQKSYRNEYLTFSSLCGDWHERYNDDSKLTHEELLSKLHLVGDELTYTRNNTHNIFLKFEKNNPEAYKELQSIAENMSAYDWEY